MSITVPILILVVHFVADFLLQSNWMAMHKSKRWDALAYHVTIYSACFLWCGWKFVLITWGTHFVTDAITSRITSRLWFVRTNEWGVAAYDMDKRHWFFVAIGYDQLIHAFTLALTLKYLQ